MRKLYVVGGLYVGLCAASVGARLHERGLSHPSTPLLTTPTHGAGTRWFAQVRSSCNVVEIATLLRRSPAPPGPDGAAYQAACHALAGQMERADQLIAAMPPRARGTAAYVMFEIGHPVADSGDDRSAGPMMRLVLKYWPENYMALYHAGMSECMLGDRDVSRQHLERFLQLYKPEDGWRQAAKRVLAADIAIGSCRGAPG